MIQIKELPRHHATLCRLLSTPGHPMQQFHVHKLAPEDAHTAYPLVREAEPGVALQSWLGFVRRTARPALIRTGIRVATRDGQRFPSGLFCYRCHCDLSLGDVVTADYFVAVDILDPTPVVSALVRALEQLGEALRCDAVRSMVHSHACLLRGCLESEGHRLETTNFVKRLPARVGAEREEKLVLF